jgi:lactoylglutathione lyase
MARQILMLAMLLFLGNRTLACANDTNPANEIGIQYLGHVAVGVSDLDRALHFYRDQLGLTEVFRMNGPNGTPFLVYLRVNNNNFVELFPGSEKQAEGESKRPGVRHLGFFVKDLQATLRTLQARGYPVPEEAFKQAARVQADGTLLCFIKDPDGNAIELSQILPNSKQAQSQR